MKYNFKNSALSALTLITFTLCARDPHPENAHFNIGRETITSKDYRSWDSEFFFIDFKEDKDIIFANTFSYGITRWLGCTFSFPTFLKRQVSEQKTRGLADIFANLQWHVYRQPEQIAILKTGMLFPTGDSANMPPIGTGSFNPFFRFIGIHSSEKLFASCIFGSIITTKRKNRKASTVLEYELSIGPKFKIGKNKDTWLYTFLEMEGFYFRPSRGFGARIDSTGGNVLRVGPFLSIEHYPFQWFVRLLLPISQHRFGAQRNNNFRFNIASIYTF